MATNTAHIAHRTRSATYRAGTPVSMSLVARDTSHTTQHTERAHHRSGAQWPRTPHAQHNTLSGYMGVQEPMWQRPPHTQHTERANW